jgi:hypothetical protein
VARAAAFRPDIFDHDDGRLGRLLDGRPQPKQSAFVTAGFGRAVGRARHGIPHRRAKLGKYASKVPAGKAVDAPANLEPFDGVRDRRAVDRAQRFELLITQGNQEASYATPRAARSVLYSTKRV